MKHPLHAKKSASNRPVCSCKRQAGWSLAELVLVIVLSGILMATVAPKFFGRDAFDEKLAQDGLIMTARYAQQLAMSDSLRTVALVLADHQYGIQIDGHFIESPSGGSYPVVLSDSLNLPTQTLTFQTMGGLSNTARIPITYEDATVVHYAVCISRVGYAHACE